MTTLTAILLLVITQSPQDDYEKWDREKVTPTKERIDSGLMSDAKRQWWEARFSRARTVFSGDELILFGGEFYHKGTKTAGSIGKTTLADSKLTITHIWKDNEYPQWKETFVPVRWGKQVLHLDDNKYELLRFCNDFNSGDLPWMDVYYATSHQDLNFSKLPEVSEAYRDKLLTAPLEYVVSEVVNKNSQQTVPLLERGFKGTKVKVKFTTTNRPYLAMTVFADRPYGYLKGWVVAIGDGECEIAMDKLGVHRDLAVGESLSTKKPPSLLNETVWWRPEGEHAMSMQCLHPYQLGPDKKDPTDEVLLRWLNDDLRWVVAHVILVSRYLPQTKLQCEESGDHFNLEYAGLALTLPKQPKDAGKNWLPEPNYGDAKAQQIKLIEFWTEKLEGAKN